ncbi:MAG: Sapep family Mn(2+)-dependent dipeptidase [Candidatus Sumerlaeia bacterium]|nr:Sapep family Mn(2+)-dependent dipeptidase [Candidatus Sumerlaeia bacterium]
MWSVERLHQLVELRADFLVGTLCDLLRFETVGGANTPDAVARFNAETRRCLDYLRRFAGEYGLVWREHPAGVGVIEWGEGEETIGFPTHCDVVPAVGQWRHPPFGGVVEGDMIYGRGTQDNKGPLACGLTALLAIRDLGCPTRRKIRLIFGTHEEGGEWTDISAYLADEPPPLYCIVPDATFPIINGEKGMATLLLKPPAFTAPERKDGLRLDAVHSGVRANVVPDRAVVQLSGPVERRDSIVAELKEELEAYGKSRPLMMESPLQVCAGNDPNRFTATLVFLGKSAHGSRPYEGHNAAVDALGYLVRLHFPAGAAMDFLGLAYCAGKDLSGEYLNIRHTHSFIGPTTASLNIFDLEAPDGQAQINVRHPLGLTSAEVLERVRAEVDKKIPEPERRPSVAFDGIVYEPLFTDPEQYPDLFAALREAWQSVTGREARCHSTGGTTYAKGFPRAVSFGPTDVDAGEPDLCHKADECVSRAALIRNAKVYAHALARLALV